MQPALDDIDGDDEELACVADFGDDLSGCSIKGAALDDVLRFAGAAIALPLDDLAREDDVFEIKDGEVVIFKFVRGMGGDGIAESSDQLAKVGDGHLGHAQVYEGSEMKAFFCGLTFELSGRRRQDARPALQKMYTVPAARAWWPAVGAPLERGVRRRCD